MSDETFRQERKKIDPAEFHQQTTASQVHAFQKSLGIHVADDVDNPNPPQYSNPQAIPAVKPLEGRQVSGNMPPAMQELMRQQLGIDDQQLQPSPFRPQVMATGNATLDELMSGLNTNTQHYEQVNLPSLGRFYSGPSLPGSGVLNIRPMTGKEEQLLATQRYMKNGRSLNMIFKSCIREPVDVERLLIVDRTYLLIYIRGISYGEFYDVSIKCPSCGNNFEHSINLNSLNIDYCPEDFSADNLTDKLPNCGYKFKYKLPTWKDDNDITEYMDRRKRQLPDAVDDTFFQRAAYLIQSIGTDEKQLTDPATIKTLLQNMIVADVNYVRNVLTDPPFGVNTEISIICTSCLHEFDVELPLDASFFFPKNRKMEE